MRRFVVCKQADVKAVAFLFPAEEYLVIGTGVYVEQKLFKADDEVLRGVVLMPEWKDGVNPPQARGWLAQLDQHLVPAEYRQNVVL